MKIIIQPGSASGVGNSKTCKEVENVRSNKSSDQFRQLKGNWVF